MIDIININSFKLFIKLISIKVAYFFHIFRNIILIFQFFPFNIGNNHAYHRIRIQSTYK